MTSPRATLRLQFHKNFTFADAARLVPYFSALGIGHVYASPILTARPGSLHGYDVLDPTRVNPELGGEDGLRELVTALRRADLGLIVDIVPNHMAVGAANAWWWDVLQNGRASAYAHFFDIDWEVDDPELRGKVLAPFLGRSCAEALSAGEITLVHDAARGYVIKYFEHIFPVARADWSEIEHHGLAAFAPATANGRERLSKLLARQHYRLAWWRVANDEINWRRFFDINDLIAVRVEHDDVFEATHATLLRLYGEGLIDGVRVDHVDGLSHPGHYARKLRARLATLESVRPADAPAGPAYIVVEKILALEEHLRRDWECDGTSGYDFMDQISAVLHDGNAEQPLAQLWARVSGRSPSFAVEAQASRREILDRSFTAQLDAAARAFHRLTRAGGSDVSRAALRRALSEILAHFPVYRLYTAPGQTSEEDLVFLRRALAGAAITCLPGDRPVVDLLGRWLAGEAAPAADEALHARALTTFHQLGAPVAAKAVEDTAFYRYGAALSRIDVGFDPTRFAATPGDFHAAAQARREHFPSSMLATATHDHKRGEDVRARLAVLSEIPDQWAAALDRWLSQSAPLCETIAGAPVPHARDIALLLQTIVGAWPPMLTLEDAAGCKEFAERLAGWQQKALREAKLVSDWTAPNEAYESAAHGFLMRLFAGEADLLPDIARFAHRIGPAGAANGLAQTLLKLTAPGVPDIYQGTDYWDLSLVDPENRRPVDFTARMASLDATPLGTLVASWRDGRIKQAVITRTLAVRRAAPRLFAEGSYQPIEVEGALARHIVAFARVRGDEIAITVACRLTFGLLADDRLSIQRLRWSGMRLRLPPECRSAQLRDALSGADFDQQDAAELTAILPRLPIALLTSKRLAP
ncbi:MAG TPA: malto-oligosyltrehalose synthase [Xanthobacteraceae bacterium]|jgi:malto-oligosyltrehalose synthase|nr:malto-oligosyltrehalose synthase [Xanthobacteraceae bacterium]